MEESKGKVAREKGQSIVLLAFAMIGLLVFAGLAVDAGVIYVTKVRLSRAVDAAALAGVVELPSCDITGSPCLGTPFSVRTCLADDRARQFLAANEIWPTAEVTGTVFFDSSRQSGVFGTFRYWITATHQADLYFMPVVNFRHVRLRDSAVAEYNPLVNMYASQTGNYGLEQTSNLSIFGPDICTSYGDAYTPLTGNESGTTPNPWYDELNGVYHFQLEIPANYESRAEALTAKWNSGDTNDVVRVEIWDPDSYNSPFTGNQFVITNTTSVTGALIVVTNACGSNDRKQPCVPLLRAQDPQNPFGFVRIDENRGHGTAPGDGQCGGGEETDPYTVGYNTDTEYTLYYFRRRGDGSVEGRNLARYTKGGADSDSDTDMRWICPGGNLPGDPPADADFVPDAGDGDFEIDLSTEAPNIYVSPAGKRSLFLDVRGVDGASENGFDLWAGPRYRTVPSEVNARNVDILHPLHAGDYHSSAGATFFGMGHLPMNSNATEVVTLTLAAVPQEWAGRTMRVSSFDNDAGTSQVKFIFDSIPNDWVFTGTLSGGNAWHTNVFTVPSQPDHTFYGGVLQAIYSAGAHDTYGWAVSTEGIPRLVE